MNPNQHSTQSTLRRATKEDLFQVLEIEKKIQMSPWTLENFEEETQKPYCALQVVCSEETEQVHAYIVYWMIFRECQILNLGVHPSFRGRGFAKQLVETAVRSAFRKKLQKVFLEVRKSNQAAIELYQGLGFSSNHLRKGFYSDGEDAWIMERYLDPSKPLLNEFR